MLNLIWALFTVVVKFSCAHQNKYKPAGHVQLFRLCFVLKAEFGLSQTANCWSKMLTVIWAPNAHIRHGCSHLAKGSSYRHQ